MIAERKRRGLTLVETVVAVIVVATLVAAVVPVAVRQSRQARANAVLSQLRALSNAMQRFEQDVGYWPPNIYFLQYPATDGSVMMCDVVLNAAQASRWRGPYISVGIPPGEFIGFGDYMINATIEYVPPLDAAAFDPEAGMSARAQFMVDGLEDEVAATLERMMDNADGFEPVPADGGATDGAIITLNSTVGMSAIGYRFPISC